MLRSYNTLLNSDNIPWSAILFRCWTNHAFILTKNRHFVNTTRKTILRSFYLLVKLSFICMNNGSNHFGIRRKEARKEKIERK